MPPLMDLTGMRFGRWLVLELDKEKSKEKGRPYWICKCDCGTIKSVSGELLRSGKSKSCGCYKSEVVHNIFFNDLTNQRFGRYIVKEWQKEKSIELKDTYYLCKCDCGTIKSVRAGDLTSGKILSCGCLQREQASKCNTKSNEIIIRYELGYAEVYFNNCDEYFKCDIEDLDIVRQCCWYKNMYGYAVATNNNNQYHTTFFHRMVMIKYFGFEVVNSMDTDHANHDKLDDRRDNLRLCSPSDNNRNRYHCSNTGYRNIHCNKNGKFQCEVRTKNEACTKTFDNINDALEWVDDFYRNHPELNEFLYKEQYDETMKETFKNKVYPFINMEGNPIIRTTIQPFVFTNLKDNK